MNFRIISTMVLGLVVSAAAGAQNAQPATPNDQNPGMGGSSGFGQRGGMGMAAGRGLVGTVTEVTADHFTVKNLNGETYTIHYSVNTRFMKQVASARSATAGQQGQTSGAEPGQGRGQGRGQGGGWSRGQGLGSGNAGLPIKSTDIKVGDAIAAMGEVDASAKSVGAVGVFLLDPDRAKQMEQMQASYGKTWLMGKVTSIQDVQVTIQGTVDNTPHTFAADENTAFRERRNPITLADIKVGDNVRAEGAVKDGMFTATTVNVMTPPTDGPRAPRNSSPPQ